MFDCIAMNASMKQFNFSRQWRRRITPLLNDEFVASALTTGLWLDDSQYEPGTPPWKCGRGQWNGQRAKPGSLSWFQPWGRCHAIAPFSWAVGIRLFPNLEWGFITSDHHTVAIGFESDWHHPSMVMDILLFRDSTAQRSLDFAMGPNWRFCENLGDYASCFLEGVDLVTPEERPLHPVLGTGGVLDQMNERFTELMQHAC